MIEAVAERLEGAPRQLRRRWSDEFKAQAVAEALEPDASVSAIAHRIGIGRPGWVTFAYSPVIGLPPIRELRFRLKGCCPFGRSERDRIFIQRKTSKASCRPLWICGADIPAASSGHGHTIACSDC